MLNLALVGRSISHSRSPEIYKELLSSGFGYNLLDYKEEEAIPSLSALFEKYSLDGLSVTSPYKKYFYPQVVCDSTLQKLGEQGIDALNCIKHENGKFVASNTDYLAICHLLGGLDKDNAVILGDGVMAQITQIALRHLEIPFEVFSRKNIANLSDIDLRSKGDNLLVINACGREFIFNGLLDSSTIFWDYNYDHPQHLNAIPPKSKKYIDGISLLKSQAKYALDFWKLSNF